MDEGGGSKRIARDLLCQASLMDDDEDVPCVRPSPRRERSLTPLQDFARKREEGADNDHLWVSWGREIDACEVRCFRCLPFLVC